ncbi:MAG: class I SAM-dependent methyltransferase [Clostridium sp.]|uniref:class I SAM-dependent DNA methyltransferase n=1 Tax=Clostridium sp. TaxID=1506 RepID=UPI003061A002
MECYNDFASIYDELINEDIDYRSWADRIIEICKEDKIIKRDYLDLACGTGNLTVLIGKEFIFTTAVDLSEEMLSIADEKLKEENIKVKVSCQDICNLSLNKQFDLITCALDSTNYITDDLKLKQYFMSVNKHLKENGVFIFDINTEYKIKSILGNNTFNYDNEDVVYVWENQLEDDIVNMYLIFFVKNGQVYYRFDEHHREKAYSEAFLETVMKSSGLIVEKKLNCYGDEDINQSTERITYVVRKERGLE